MDDARTAEYRARVAEAVGTPKTPGYERHSGPYFFLSLDLVNSTAYKARNPDWQLRIRMFYDEARDFWHNHENSLHPRVWKYAGDEVLFYQKVRSIRDLELGVQSSYAALRVVSRTVRNWTEDKNPRLYVKATCWIANVEYRVPSDASVDNVPISRNIVFESPLNSGGGALLLDFLGPEIDAGFRIASGSIKNALVVSAELADLIWKKGVRKTGDGLRIVDFREFKGVWDGRLYPLIWYRDEWDQAALENDYDYDDEARFEILAKAKKAPQGNVGQLAKILAQVQRDWHGHIELPAESLEPVTDAEAVASTAAESPEVHCVAVCFDSQGRVLLAQRPSTKTSFPSKWEAGCAQLKRGDDFFTALRRDYEAAFGLKLDFSRVASWGVVGSYSFAKHHVTVPGIVFIADATNPDDLKSHKHEKAAWFDPGHLPPEVVTNGVPELEERIRRAHALWKSLAP